MSVINAQYNKNPNWIRFSLGFSIFALSVVVSPCYGRVGGKHSKLVTDTLTVARIFDPGTAKTRKIAFLRSQRFYYISVKSKPTYLTSLQQSLKKNAPVAIYRNSEKSDVIVKVVAIKR